MSLTIKGDTVLRGGSSLILDNATIAAKAIKLKGTSSMTASGATITVGNDFNIADSSGNDCTFTADSTSLRLTSRDNVFNVGYAENSTGTVVKDGGDWSCYYLRIGRNSGSTGTFTHNDGTLEVKARNDGYESEIVIGSAGTGTFTLNGGSVTLSHDINQYIGYDSGFAVRMWRLSSMRSTPPKASTRSSISTAQ